MSELTPKELKELDCFSCKVVGSGGTFAFGCYLWYVTKYGQFGRGNRAYKFFLQTLSVGSFYLSSARWLYLPPFHKLGQRPSAISATPTNQ